MHVYVRQKIAKETWYNNVTCFVENVFSFVTLNWSYDDGIVRTVTHFGVLYLSLSLCELSSNITRVSDPQHGYNVIYMN